MDTGLNRGPKGRQKGLTPKSRSQPPSKGRGKKGDIPRRTSGSRPPTNSRQVTVEEEAPSHTSAHNTAFQDRHGRLLSQGVDAAQARWKHHSDPMNVKESRTIGTFPLVRPKGFLIARNTIVFSMPPRNTSTM